MRGYFGVAIYHPKRQVNVGSLLRTANILGASFISVIGKRYKHQSSDTLKTFRHVPLYDHQSLDDFCGSLPRDCQLVGVEMVEHAEPIETFKHPQRAVYLLGAEDHGLPSQAIDRCHHVIKLRGDRSLNLAVAGSIVLYDRGARA